MDRGTTSAPTNWVGVHAETSNSKGVRTLDEELEK